MKRSLAYLFLIIIFLFWLFFSFTALKVETGDIATGVIIAALLFLVIFYFIIALIYPKQKRNMNNKSSKSWFHKYIVPQGFFSLKISPIFLVLAYVTWIVLLPFTIQHLFLPWGFNLVVSIVLLLLLPVILYYIVKYLIPKTEPTIIPKKKVDTKTKEKFKPENVVGFINIIKSSKNILIVCVLGVIIFVGWNVNEPVKRNAIQSQIAKVEPSQTQEVVEKKITDEQKLKNEERRLRVEKQRLKDEEQKQKDEEQIYKAEEQIVSASSGTGFFISNEGHIISNNHIIDACHSVKIHHKGKIEMANIISRDRMNDLTLLQTNIQPNEIFSISGNDATLLEDVYVAGYPFGKSVSSAIRVTKGVVSGLSGFGDNYANLQIDAALQPGNSGGPIIDEYGNVVGVAVAKLDLKNAIKLFGTIPENTNFGVKSSVVKSFTTANLIDLEEINEKKISKKAIAKKIQDGTVYVDCWMTASKIKEMKTKKTLFPNLELN